MNFGPRSHKKQSINKSTTAIPLFQLSLLSTKETRLTYGKLKSFYGKHGRFPSQFRPLIWRYLLKLPENTQVFADLAQVGLHSAYENLDDKYPLKSIRLLHRLQNICSLLAHWSPIFGETTYLPQLVFPFMQVYEKNELAAMETCMTLLMWWGYSWHSLFPNPPVHITSCIDSLLQAHEPVLVNHLQFLGLSPGVLAWRMISTVFSEILGSDEWLALFDYVFLYFTSRPQLMVFIPVAVFRLSRVSLLNTDCESHVLSFMTNQQPITSRNLILCIEDMNSTTPSQLYSDSLSYMLSSKVKIDSNSNKEMHRHHDGDGEEENGHVSDSDHRDIMSSLSQYAGYAIHPLPSGGYPAYSGYPKTVLDWEIKKRDAAMAFAKDIKGHVSLLDQLRDKVALMEMNHSHWMGRHSHELNLMKEQQQELMDIEKKEMLKLYSLQQEATRRRLDIIDSYNRTSAEEAMLMEQIRYSTDERNSTVLEHKEELGQIATKVQHHRELGAVADSKLWEGIQTLPSTGAVAPNTSSSIQRVEGKPLESTSQDSGMLSSIPNVEYPQNNEASSGAMLHIPSFASTVKLPQNLSRSQSQSQYKDQNEDILGPSVNITASSLQDPPQTESDTNVETASYIPIHFTRHQLKKSQSPVFHRRPTHGLQYNSSTHAPSIRTSIENALEASTISKINVPSEKLHEAVSEAFNLQSTKEQVWQSKSKRGTNITRRPSNIQNHQSNSYYALKQSKGRGTDIKPRYLQNVRSRYDATSLHSSSTSNRSLPNPRKALTLKQAHPQVYPRKPSLPSVPVKSSLSADNRAPIPTSLNQSASNVDRESMSYNLSTIQTKNKTSILMPAREPKTKAVQISSSTDIFASSIPRYYRNAGTRLDSSESSTAVVDENSFHDDYDPSESLQLINKLMREAAATSSGSVGTRADDFIPTEYEQQERDRRDVLSLPSESESDNSVTFSPAPDHGFDS